MPAYAGARAELTLGHEALIGACLAIAAWLALTRRGGRAIAAATRAIIPREHIGEPPPAGPPGDTAAAFAIAALAVVIALPWLDVTDAQGLAFRLRIAAFVPLALLAATLAGRLAAWLRHATSRSPRWPPWSPSPRPASATRAGSRRTRRSSPASRPWPAGSRPATP